VECANGNKRVVPNPTYLFTAIEATIRNCTRMRRIRPIRETESEIEPRGVEKTRKNEK